MESKWRKYKVSRWLHEMYRPMAALELQKADLQKGKKPRKGDAKGHFASNTKQQKQENKKIKRKHYTDQKAIITCIAKQTLHLWGNERCCDVATYFVYAPSMLTSHKVCNGCYVMPCSHTSHEFDKVLELGNSTPNKKHNSHAIDTDSE